MKEYRYYRNCGCCDDIAMFESDDSASRTFAKAGLTSNGTFVDDAGEMHESVDTFYGIHAIDNIPENAGTIGYLADKLIGNE